MNSVPAMGCPPAPPGCSALSGGIRSSSLRRGPLPRRSSSSGARGLGCRDSTRPAARPGWCAPGRFGSTTAGFCWRCGARPASTSTGWARTRPGGLTPMIPFGGWSRCPPGGTRNGPSTRSKRATATMIRCLAPFPTRILPVFAPARRILEWPVVPTGVRAPGTYSRHEYYLARLGPPPRRGRHGRQVRAASRATGRLPWCGPRLPPSWAPLAVVPRMLGQRVRQQGRHGE